MRDYALLTLDCQCASMYGNEVAACYFGNTQSMSIVSALMGLLFLSRPGIAALPAHTQVAPVAPIPAYTATLTAYNAVPAQTDGNPSETASGLYANPETIAARSQDFAKELPFGTIIELDGPAGSSDTCGLKVVRPIIGYRIIADTMNARYTKYVDVLFGTNENYILMDGRTLNASDILGVCTDVTIKVVGHIDFATQAVPKTQKELAAFVRTQSGGVALR